MSATRTRIGGDVVTLATRRERAADIARMGILTTWTGLIGAFVLHLSAGGRAKGTRDLRRYHLLSLAEVSTSGPLQITTDEIAVWLDRDDWNQNTRRSHRTSACQFFAWLTATGRRLDNPAALLATVTGVIGRPRPIPEQSLRGAVATAPPRERLMIALAAGAGLRRAEVAAVHRDHVERTLDGWTLRVLGKGERERLVPIADDLAEALRARPGYAFPSPQGGHLTPAHVGKLVTRLLPEGWTTHTLRHRFASAAYRADRDIRAVQELLGHASVATTQIYTAVPDDAVRRAAGVAAVRAVA